jgi:hypothetical protein
MLAAPVAKGLLLHKCWLDEIVAGRKTLDIRGQNTRIRGTIGLVETKTGLLRRGRSRG